MQLSILLTAFAISCVQAETVFGVFIVSRHGDRTAKATPPSNLTDLGYQEVFTSGTYFRNRYIAANATNPIVGISSDLVALSQISVSAPVDNVLMSSALGFSQGLYPPAGPILGQQTLRNGTIIEAPLNGYQLIPITTVGSVSGTNNENQPFLQSTNGCTRGITSSNEYLTTPEFLNLLASTRGFYQSLEPLIEGTFNSSQASFANAYTIFDILNVASIDNATFDPGNTLTPEALFQARTLADNHEFNLAYNNSDPIRAIAGSVLAGQIVTGLNATINTAGRIKLQAQFSAYNGFLSFFGLANLTAVDTHFFGIPDYASTMTFELFTNDTAATPFPVTEDLNVRFLFHNGTTSPTGQPAPFPLFDQPSTVLSWADFAASMAKFAVFTEAQFCSACGVTTGTCALAA